MAVFTAIQVTVSLSNQITKKRELASLEEIDKELQPKTMLLITENEEGEEVVNGNKVQVLPIWKWLLKES